MCHLTRKGPLLKKKNNKQTSVWSHKKGTVPEKQIVSSHKTGTAPSQADCSVISQDRNRSKPSRLQCHLTRKGPLLQKKKLLCHLTNKGTAPQNRQRPQSKLSQQITECEWISGTLSQHVAWLCDSRFSSQGVLYHPKRGQAELKKGS